MKTRKTRLTFAGLKYNELGSFDYGRNYGVAYDAAAYTDMLVEWGGDSPASADNFMNGRTNGVATYRNYDFFGWLMVLILRFSTKAKTATVALRNKMVTAMRCL